MKKTLFATIIAALIGFFGSQAMACGNKQCSGSCQQQHDQGKGQSCGCKGNSCSAGK